MDFWQRAGLTEDERVAHVRRKAADRQKRAQLQAVNEDLVAAAASLRGALAQETHLAAANGDEVEVVAALLTTWAGSSSEELLSTARALLAGRQPTPEPARDGSNGR